MIIGITGSIGTGKTTLCNTLYKCKNLNPIVIFNDDNCANDLIKNNKVINFLNKEIPESIIDNKINKDLLRRLFFKDKEKLKQLENVIHPLVNEQRVEFLKNNKDKNIIIDSPLLFEKNIDKFCNFVIVTFCSKETQQNRVLNRKTITKEELEFILKKQLPLKDKIKKADYIINTEKPLLESEIEDLLQHIIKKHE